MRIGATVPSCRSRIGRRTHQLAHRWVEPFILGRTVGEAGSGRVASENFTASAQLLEPKPKTVSPLALGIMRGFRLTPNPLAIFCRARFDPYRMQTTMS